MKRRLFNVHVSVFKDRKLVASGVACSSPVGLRKVYEKYAELVKFRTKVRSNQTTADLEIFQYALLQGSIVRPTSVGRAEVPNAQLKLSEEISFTVVEADLATIHPHGNARDNWRISYF